jgi:Cd2+/Zn2+-exporting ATPase/Cu+-exporting ATPase
LIKGGRVIEALARADVLLIDKTGTLTLGQPHLAGLAPADGVHEAELLALAAAAERYSEHPLAGAIRRAAGERGLEPAEPEQFEAVPGKGVRAVVAGRQVVVGSRAWAGWSSAQSGGLDGLGDRSST